MQIIKFKIMLLWKVQDWLYSVKRLASQLLEKEVRWITAVTLQLQRIPVVYDQVVLNISLSW